MKKNLLLLIYYTHTKKLTKQSTHDNKCQQNKQHRFVCRHFPSPTHTHIPPLSCKCQKEWKLTLSPKKNNRKHETNRHMRQCSNSFCRVFERVMSLLLIKQKKLIIFPMPRPLNPKLRPLNPKLHPLSNEWVERRAEKCSNLFNTK